MLYSGSDRRDALFQEGLIYLDPTTPQVWVEFSTKVNTSYDTFGSALQAEIACFSLFRVCCGLQNSQASDSKVQSMSYYSAVKSSLGCNSKFNKIWTDLDFEYFFLGNMLCTLDFFKIRKETLQYFKYQSLF